MNVERYVVQVYMVKLHQMQHQRPNVKNVYLTVIIAQQIQHVHYAQVDLP